MSLGRRVFFASSDTKIVIESGHGETFTLPNRCFEDQELSSELFGSIGGFSFFGLGLRASRALSGLGLKVLGFRVEGFVSGPEAFVVAGTSLKLSCQRDKGSLC